jgi:glycosyltransferase involved in cell wall biosynthesis
MLYKSAEIQEQKTSHADSPERPIKVLQVVHGMGRAGLETWLMHVLRNIDRSQFHMDFLVSVSCSCDYDHEIRQLGSRIIPCLYPRRPWIFGPAFKDVLRQYGPYDVVHSHIHHYSGYILRLAKQAGVPVRIAHSHVDSRFQETNAGMIRRRYLDLMKSWIHRYATAGFSCSCEAAEDLFGLSWKTDPRWQILHYGIDPSPFQTSVDRATVRAELGIPETAFVLGHVGRFAEQKNHRFLVDIFSKVVQQTSNAYLLLVGEGELQPEIEQLVHRANLADRVIFTGSCSNVPRLMLGAMDVFVMPSLFEGLPVTLLEAQLANLPMVFANHISEEVDIIKPLIQRVDLAQPTSVWADAVKEIFDSSKISFTAQPSPRKNSLFSITNSIKKLEVIYAS